MKCPHFVREYIGVCAVFKFPYIPSTGERECYCSQKNFRFCPLYLDTLEKAGAPQKAVPEPDLQRLPEQEALQGGLNNG